MAAKTKLKPAAVESRAGAALREAGAASALARPGVRGRGLDFQARRVVETEVQRIDLEDVRRGVGLSVCPTRGAEVSSLRVREAGRCHELLYRGNDWSAVEGWSGRAPWLWPVAGRCYADDAAVAAPDRANACAYRLGDRIIPMPVHGFARHRAWRADTAIATPGNATAGMTYKSDAPDREAYPFAFALGVDAGLDAEGASLRFSCESSAENDRSMPFTLGCHLTLDLRSWWGERWLDGTVRGLGDRAWGTDQRMQAADAFDLPAAPRLGDAALASALVPANPETKARLEAEPTVRLTSPCGRRSLVLSLETEGDDEAAAGSGGELLWVVYRDPGDRFFCCEPWVGWPNAINTGRGRVELSPGRRWSMTLRLGVETGDSSPAAMENRPFQGPK